MGGRQGAGISSEIETKSMSLGQQLSYLVVRGLASRLRLKPITGVRGINAKSRRQGAGISSEIETVKPHLSSIRQNCVVRGLASRLRLKPLNTFSIA